MHFNKILKKKLKITFHLWKRVVNSLNFVDSMN